METRVAEIAERIRGLREMMDMTPAEVATAVGVSEEEYLNCENAKTDFVKRIFFQGFQCLFL